MSTILRLLFLASCVSTTWMHYTDIHDGDSSSIVFPSSHISASSTAQPDQNTGHLHRPYFHAVEALFAVSTRLKALLGSDAEGNVLFSPITTTTALAELLLGARGSSRSQILNILTAANRTRDTAEATAAEFHQHLGNLIRTLRTSAVFDNSYYLHLASALFAQLGQSLFSNFINAATELYGMNIMYLDFNGDPSGSLGIINRWAAMNTLGAINRVFSHPLPATTAAVLTNAIYFSGAWETPFNSQYTVPGKFKYNDTHRIDVQFMRGQFNLRYAESTRLGCRMISIPYKHDQAAMYAILPDTGDLYNIHNFASGLSLDDVTELIDSTRTASVTLIMPKMRLAETFSIRKALYFLQKQIESQFQEETFSPSLHQNNTNENEPVSCCSSNCSDNCQTFCNAEDRDVNTEEERFAFNMSGISTNDNFRINDIIQHVFLEVNEVGTVAAAVGTTLVDYSGEFKDFKMERPFVFFIRHEITGAPLFWGAIVDPTIENA